MCTSEAERLVRKMCGSAARLEYKQWAEQGGFDPWRVYWQNILMGGGQTSEEAWEKALATVLAWSLTA